MPYPSLDRSDLPAELTPETLRTVPMGVLRRLSRPGNGVLDAEEQRAFDAALHELMSQMARRVHQQVQQTDWDSGRRRGPGGRPRGARGGVSPREQRNLDRIAKRIEAQVDAVEDLAPGIDWTLALPPAVTGNTSEPVVEAKPTAPSSPGEKTEAGERNDGQTVDDVERSISDQVELVAVMNDIAEVSRRTYALEQEREAANTRGVFFGFLVSIAVIVAGWAPLVVANWHQRLWTLGLTLVTCLVAGAVYAVVLRRQVRDEDAEPPVTS